MIISNKLDTAKSESSMKKSKNENQNSLRT